MFVDWKLKLRACSGRLGTLDYECRRWQLCISSISKTMALLLNQIGDYFQRVHFKSIKSYRVLDIIGTRFSKILICFCINKCLGFSGSLNCMRSTDLDSSFLLSSKRLFTILSYEKKNQKNNTHKSSDFDTKICYLHCRIF